MERSGTLILNHINDYLKIIPKINKIITVGILVLGDVKSRGYENKIRRDNVIITASVIIFC